MDELKRLYTELYNIPAPKGFSRAAEDLDILVYQDADHIMGLVNSYLAGEKIDLANIGIDEELDRKLDECEIKLKELKVHKKKHDALAKVLIDSLSKNLSS
jgi:hypothetical protein